MSGPQIARVRRDPGDEAIEVVARKRGQDADLVGVDVEALANAGRASHQLQHRAVAEIDRRSPEATAENPPGHDGQAGQGLGDPDSADGVIGRHYCVRLS